MPAPIDPSSPPQNTEDGGQDDFHQQFFAFHSEADNLEADEPWHEADLDGDPHEHGDEPEAPVAFGEPPELDFRSLERWFQSCLRRLVNPALSVDGIYGRGTRRALRTFQRNYNKNHPDSEPLDVDGLPGPASSAALAECTGSTAPTIREKQYQASLKQTANEAEPETEAAPVDTASGLTVTSSVRGKKKTYTIRGHGEEVSFRYRTTTTTLPTGKTTSDPYNVSRYKGGKTDLLSDRALANIGYTPAEIKILKANALKESGGKFGAMNTWDNQIVSWGMAQFAGHAGTLAGLLRSIKEDYPEAFSQHFLATGIDINSGPYPYYDRSKGSKSTRKGTHIVIKTQKRTYAGDDAWSYMRTQPKLIGAMMIAGNDLRIQMAQCAYWKRSFLDRAVNTVVGYRRCYSVVQITGKGRKRREQVLLSPTRSRAEWEAWAKRPENHVGGKNLATLFAKSPRSKIVIDDPSKTAARIRVTVERQGGAAIRKFVTSEYGLGLIARLYNWMPAYVRAWSEDFITILASEYPGREVRDPKTWEAHSDLETAFRELIKDRRRDVKKGSYDTYGLDLDQSRGSFYGQLLVAAFSVETPERDLDGAPTEPEPEPDDSPTIAPNEPGPTVSNDKRPTPPPVGDPATLQPDVDVTDKSPTKKRKRKRQWEKITGITLHQTGIHGFGARAWPRVTSHLGVHSDGRVFLIHPLESYLWSSDSLNRDTIAIEVAGNFLRDEGKPNSYWKKGGGPSPLTDPMVAGLRRAIRYIMAEVASHGGEITQIRAHRQAKKAKAACPGAAIWQSVGVWAQVELGLSDGGPGWTRSDGQAIPPYWDSRLLDGPITFFEDDEFFDDDAFASELDEEYPSPEDLIGWNTETTTRPRGIVQVRGIPSGTRIANQEEADLDAPTSRGDLDFSAPFELDDAPPDPFDDILEQAIVAGGLTLIDQVELTPDADAPVSRGEFDDDDALEFDITVEEDEGTIVLLAQDGLYRWILPTEEEEDGPTSRAADGPSHQFRIPLDQLVVVDDSAPAEGATRGFLSDTLTGGVRALVYKYVLSGVAKAAAGTIVNRLDGNVREGPVIIPSTDMEQWVDADDLSSLNLPTDRPARVLLLIHGTFSSTRSSFGALTLPESEILPEALSDYDAVFGIDHRTLSRWPSENAKDIADHLVGPVWAQPPVIDVVSFSRGGLVARTLIERELPKRGWKGTIAKAIFVATTNAGTELARAKNWHTLADILTSISNVGSKVLSMIPGAGHVASLIARELISGIAGFLKELANAGITAGLIPGLSAMDPDSEVIAELNETPLPAPVTAKYYGMNSRFEPAASLLPSGLKTYLLSQTCKKLYRGEASDLVVHNKSTRTLHPEIAFTSFFHFETNAIVFHTNFFAQLDVHKLLKNWLDLPDIVTELDEFDIVIDEFLPDEDDELDYMDLPLDFSGGDDGMHSDDDNFPISFGDPDDDFGPGEDITLHMQSSVPTEVETDTVFTVHVTLSREEIQEAVAGLAGVDATGTVSTEEAIEVEIVPRAGVTLEGYQRVEVGVPPPTGNIGVFFRVRAGDEGTAKMWVLVHQDGRCALRSILEVRVVARSAHDLGNRMVVGDDLPAFDPSMAPADPSLEVIEMHESGGMRFRYQLTSQRLGLNHRFESPRITGDAVGYFGGFYARIEKEWKTANQNPRMFQRLLRALGTQLGEQLLPRDLRIKLWQLKDKLHGLQILSDETYIPWEMVHLKHPDEPLPRGESHFLGQLGLVRSMWESAPASRIVVRPGGARTLVPTYPSPRVALPQAQAERDWFAERFASTPLPATSEDVLDAFEVAGDFDLLHVACHGDLADRDAWLILEGSTRKGKWYPDKLSASIVAATADLGKGTANRPMVFLNACKVARQEDLLSSACGWAPTLLRAGAGALVAPMWKVGDSTAQKFSQGFYGALLKGASFARAAMAAREYARAQGDPTWLAYVVYAHPRCTLKIEPGT